MLLVVVVQAQHAHPLLGHTKETGHTPWRFGNSEHLFAWLYMTVVINIHIMFIVVMIIVQNLAYTMHRVDYMFYCFLDHFIDNN